MCFLLSAAFYSTCRPDLIAPAGADASVRLNLSIQSSERHLRRSTGWTLGGAVCAFFFYGCEKKLVLFVPVSGQRLRCFHTNQYSRR